MYPDLAFATGAAPAHAPRSASPPVAPSKGSPWTDAEHLAFLDGLAALGKGKWREISKKYVPSRTPTQVASHAQKHFIRLARGGVPARRRSRFSAIEAAAAVRGALADPSLTVVGRGGPGGATGLGALLAAASVEESREAAIARARSATPPSSLRASPSPVVRPIPRPASDVALDKLAAITAAPSPPPAAVGAPPAPRAGSAFAPAAAVLLPCA